MFPAIYDNKHLAAILPSLVITTFFIILFLLLTLYAKQLEAVPGVMLWYAPAGLNFAFLFTFGLRYLFAIVLAGFLGGYFILMPHAPLISLIIVAVTTPLAEAATVAVARRKLTYPWNNWHIRDLMLFAGTVLITPLLAGSAGLLNYMYFGLISPEKFFSVLINWWIGDVIGILSITPFLMVNIKKSDFFPRSQTPQTRSQAPQTPQTRSQAGAWERVCGVCGAWERGKSVFKKSGLQIFTTGLVLWISYVSHDPQRVCLFYLIFVPLVWIISDYGFPGATVSILGINMAIHVFVHKIPDTAELAEFQLFMIIISFAGLFLGVSVTERKQAAELMRKSEENLRNITNKIPGMVYQYAQHRDGSFSFPFISERVYEYSGNKPEEALSDPSLLFQPIHPDDIEMIQQKISESADTLKIFRAEHRLIAPDGSIKWFYAKSTPKLQENGDIVWTGVAIDITDRKHAEINLQESEEKYRILVENTLQALAVYQDDKIVFGNTMLAQITGYSLDELYAMNADGLSRLIFEEDREKLWKNLHDRIGGKPVPPSQEFRVVRKDGTVRWVQNFATFTMYQGRPASQVTYIDITERKLAEKSLQESEMRYRNILENMPIGMFQSTPDGKFIYVNPAIPDMLAYASPDELIRTVNRSSIADALYEDPKKRPVFLQEVKNSRGKWKKFENRYRRKDGRIIDTMLSFCEQTDTNGQEFLYGFVLDITKRKFAEKILKESEHRLRSILNATTAAVALLDPQGIVVDANEVYAARFNLKPNELIGQCIWELFPSEVTRRRKKLVEHVFLTGKPVRSEDERSGMWNDFVIYPIYDADGNVKNVTVYAQDITERKLAEEELRRLKDQFHAENIYLREEIQLEHNFSEIIGKSEALRYVLFKIEQVAPSDTAVLIMGETGTGKDLAARAIHNLSSRKERPLIKVNCASLPAHLIESELFGHEKGAFTGADSRRIGRFELAEGTTIFLDEIGEIPLELQAKLLRVLQDGEFERLGSSKTRQADIRVIAATNRDLEAEIKAGRFRQDLYYRLNIYPITVPPLRQRADDIPMLVRSFVEKLNKKLGKTIEKIPQHEIRRLQRYPWPGNIRELRNIIERAVITSQDRTLRIELPTKTQTVPEGICEDEKTLEAIEREYIRHILELKNWRIDGPEGAALVLGLKPSTLRFRLKKLGLKRP
jgi:PAS domain S-box-containing protein